MMYLEDGITFETKMGDGSDPDQGAWGKLKSAGKRAIAGESLFLTHFTNSGSGRRKAAFAAPYPSKVVPLDLAQVGGRIIAQKESFLCAAMGTKLDIAFNKKLGTGLFGGEGFILEDIQGDGLAFLHAGARLSRSGSPARPCASTLDASWLSSHRFSTRSREQATSSR